MACKPKPTHTDLWKMSTKWLTLHLIPLKRLKRHVLWREAAAFGKILCFSL